MCVPWKAAQKRRSREQYRRKRQSLAGTTLSLNPNLTHVKKVLEIKYETTKKLLIKLDQMKQKWVTHYLHYLVIPSESRRIWKIQLNTTRMLVSLKQWSKGDCK